MAARSQQVMPVNIGSVVSAMKLTRLAHHSVKLVFINSKASVLAKVARQLACGGVAVVPEMPTATNVAGIATVLWPQAKVSNSLPYVMRRI